MYTSQLVPATFSGLRDFFDSFTDSEKAANCSITPRASVSEKDGAYTLEVEIPGVKKENVEVNVEGNELTIKETRKNGEAEVTYERSFRLSEEVDSENIGASVEDGVLRLSFTKKKSAEARKLTIQ